MPHTTMIDTQALLDLREEIEKSMRSLSDLYRRTVQEYWYIGELLNKAKDVAGHGHFNAFLEQCHIPERNARRFMKMRNSYAQISAVAGFATVEEAFDAIPKTISAQEPKPGPASRAERLEIEKAGIEHELAQTKEVVVVLQEEQLTMEKKVAAVDMAEAPQLANGLQQIGELSTTLRIARAKVSEMSQRLAEEERKVKYWRSRYNQAVKILEVNGIDIVDEELKGDYEGSVPA